MDSILAQSYENLEVVCVDNGSPDNCGKILKTYARKDKRIKVITLKENKMVCGGRNAGLDNATGDFICFVDPDDLIGKNHISTMLKAILEKKDPKGHPLNLVINNSAISFMLDGNNNKKVIHRRKVPEKVYSIQDYNENPMLEMVAPIWGRLYRKSFIDKYKIRFLDGLHTDNIPFTTKLLAHMKYWYGIQDDSNDSSYWYRLITLDGSITPYISLVSLELPVCLENLYDYLKEHNLSRKVKVMFYNFFTSYFPRHTDMPRYYMAFKKLMIKMENDIKAPDSIYNRSEINLCNYLIYTNNFFQFSDLYFKPISSTHIVPKKSVRRIKLFGILLFKTTINPNKQKRYYFLSIPIWSVRYKGNQIQHRLFAYFPLVSTQTKNK